MWRNEVCYGKLQSPKQAWKDSISRRVSLVHLSIGQKRFSSFGISLLSADMCWQVGRLRWQTSDVVLCKRNAENGALHQITPSFPLDGAQPHLSLRGAGHDLCGLISSLSPGGALVATPRGKIYHLVVSSWCLLAYGYSFSLFHLTFPTRRSNPKQPFLLGCLGGIWESYVVKLVLSIF